MWILYYIWTYLFRYLKDKLCKLYIWCAGSYIRNTHYGSGIAVTDSQCSADENLAERDLKVMMKTKSS